MLSVSGLTKRYQSGDIAQTIFRGLDLDIAKAEVVALVGASGSGKTTLLNLLSAIDAPDSGQVLIDGTNIHQLAEPHRTLLRRRQLGFVFQFFNLIPTLTVGENVALPLELTGHSSSDIRQRVTGLLDRVGLDHMYDRFPDTLSGGEQQRTAIARALAHHPKILLADEPTGNLDEDTGDRVISLLNELARDQGTTMLIVTHSPAIAQTADRVLRLQHGELSEA
ncbi:MAG: ABC transporter ATP-binding protein [Gammaproteobacteria bacterium]|nr:ABC transporter ATP-binding protein [Gammaproteobacteria bacterium]